MENLLEYVSNAKENIFFQISNLLIFHTAAVLIFYEHKP